MPAPLADYADEFTVIDVGGTWLRWARWSPRTGLGQVQRVRAPGRQWMPGADVAELQQQLIRELAARVPPAGRAAVSLGAAMDHRTATAYASAPLWGPGVRLFDVAAALRAARPDVHWSVFNDVSAGLWHLAESVRARSPDKICLVTVSTGIACRTMDVRTGRIPVDGAGLQGEIGHLPATVLLDGVPVLSRCDCGESGHVAAYSSGPGIRRVAAEMVRRHPPGRSQPPSWTTSTEDFEGALRTALDHGDTTATRLLDLVTGPIADVLRTALCLDPEIGLIAVTGGVAVGLDPHYTAALHGHLRTQGLYLTAGREPGWLLDRIVVVGPEVADPLVGACLATMGGRCGVAESVGR